MEKLSLFTRVGTARINAAQCPQLAKADISPPDGNSGYDPERTIGD